MAHVSSPPSDAYIKARRAEISEQLAVAKYARQTDRLQALGVALNGLNSTRVNVTNRDKAAALAVEQIFEILTSE